ncbi:hypothetical protein QVD17_02887 [Tagetes erecta]|uniref:Uncharacterized protein n=1 Tax=Tagetes erecta TaxID=13708 RepID=A0AAD8P9F3_TARER|nr:hypothetical protein QVD17_02887 [Tagetes erecta]
MAVQTDMLIEDLIMTVGMMIIKNVKSMQTKIIESFISYLPIQVVAMIIREENMNISDLEMMLISTLEMVQDIEVAGISIKGTMPGMKNDPGIIIKTLHGGILRS